MTVIEIPAEPTANQLRNAKQIIRRAGINPADPYAVSSAAAHVVSPHSVVRALGILASQQDCPMGCGRKLDVTNRDALGLHLCPPCMHEAETENAHSDGHHIDEPDAECAACQAGPDAAAILAAVTAGPLALLPGTRRGRPAGPKHAHCPKCGYQFTTPQAQCANKAACARRQSTSAPQAS